MYGACGTGPRPREGDLSRASRYHIIMHRKTNGTFHWDLDAL